MAFHLRLGFHIGRQNDKGVEFVGGVAVLAASAAARRTFGRLTPSTPPETS